MKSLRIISMVVFSLLTVVEPVWAQEDVDAPLNPRLNALAGASFIGPEGAGKVGGLGGGALIELGSEWHTLETGALVLRTGAAREGSVGLPIYAKFRVLDLEKQSWFIKAGAMTAFESNGYDVFAVAGLGARFTLSPRVDLVFDVTYNRGLMDSSTGQAGTNHVAGALGLIGFSFKL